MRKPVSIACAAAGLILGGAGDLQWASMCRPLPDQVTFAIPAGRPTVPKRILG